jgi:hypothetical protein
VEQFYALSVRVAVSEARRSGVRVDDALSLALVLAWELLLRYRPGGDREAAALLRTALRRALRQEAQCAAREVPVDALAILEVASPDGRPLADAEARIWWEQVLRRARLSPREREAAVAIGEAVLDGGECRVPRWLRARVRRKLRQVVFGGG